MSSVRNPGWLFYIEDCTTQLCGDYNVIKIPINQLTSISWKVGPGFFRGENMGSFCDFKLGQVGET